MPKQSRIVLEGCTRKHRPHRFDRRRGRHRQDLAGIKLRRIASSRRPGLHRRLRASGHSGTLGSASRHRPRESGTIRALRNGPARHVRGAAAHAHPGTRAGAPVIGHPLGRATLSIFSAIWASEFPQRPSEAWSRSAMTEPPRRRGSRHCGRTCPRFQRTRGAASVVDGCGVDAGRIRRALRRRCLRPRANPIPSQNTSRGDSGVPSSVRDATLVRAGLGAVRRTLDCAAIFPHVDDERCARWRRRRSGRSVPALRHAQHRRRIAVVSSRTGAAGRPANAMSPCGAANCTLPRGLPQATSSRSRMRPPTMPNKPGPSRISSCSIRRRRGGGPRRTPPVEHLSDTGEHGQWLSDAERAVCWNSRRRRATMRHIRRRDGRHRPGHRRSQTRERRAGAWQCAAHLRA